MVPARRARASRAALPSGRPARIRRALAAACLGLGLAGLVAPAGAQADHLAQLELTGVIDQVNAAYVEEALRVATDQGAAAALIVIDSPGGELTSMDRIVKAILGSEVPVITYVAPPGAQAASAATFITLAGDVAAMAPSTSIGAASVVDSSGQDLPATIKEKVTNSLAAKITDLAQRRSRNVEWAESAVRSSASANATEATAMRPPVVDLLAADVPALLAAIDAGERVDGEPLSTVDASLPELASLDVRPLRMNLGQQFIHVLSDPNVAFLLFTIGFYGIIAELLHPNWFSGFAGAIALLLAFIGANSLPLNIGGLLLILLGIGLFALELTITSHGLLTVGGAIAFVLGAFALYTGVNPQEEAVRVEVSPILIGLVLAMMLGVLFVIARGIIETRRRAAPADPMLALVGANGKAQTLIAPTGIAYAGGESWSARARGMEIPAGTPLRVVGVEGLELIVEPDASANRATEDQSVAV